MKKNINKIEEYRGCYISDIKRGDSEKNRGCYIYASLYSKNGELLVSADIDYIAHILHERMPDDVQ